MSEPTAWMLVEKLAPGHKKITPQMMKSDTEIPPVKTEKVWVEGEIVHDSGYNVTIDTGDGCFIQASDKVFDAIPPNATQKREPLE